MAKQTMLSKCYEKDKEGTVAALAACFARHQGNLSAVARELQVSRRAIYLWLETWPELGPALDKALEDWLSRMPGDS